MKPLLWTRPAPDAARVGPLLLVDRDGVIIEDRHYLADPSGVAAVPGSVQALADLKRAGWRLACVTNQSGLGRGRIAPEQFAAVQTRVDALLAAAGATLDVLVYCPHAPEMGCPCRKPATGMVDAVLDVLPGADPGLTAMVGDKLGDVELGLSIGARSFLVRTGQGAEVVPPPGVEAVADLAAAVARLREGRGT